MHRSLAIAVLGLSVLLAAGTMTASAEPPPPQRIGFVDLERLLVQTEAGKQASREFEQARKRKQEELDRKQKDLQQAAAELDKQAAVLTGEAMAEKRRELERAYVELQQTYVSLERSLAEERTKLIQRILKRAEPAIVETARSGGYHMIVDRSAVMWAEDGFDLTAEVGSKL